jgi:ribosomal-protein-alanine N-acetyltransferase
MVIKKLNVETPLLDHPDTHSDVIKTPRLTIRRLTLTDAAFVFGLVQSTLLVKVFGDKGVNSRQDAETYIQAIFDMYQKYGFGLYRVEITANGEAIGICGLVKRESLQDFDIDLRYYHIMKAMVTLSSRPQLYFD